MGINRLAFLLLAGVLVLGICPAVIAQDSGFTSGETASQQDIYSPPQAANQPYVTFSYGLAASWLTRVIYQEERSNFVFQDFLPGGYFGAELRNLRYITPMARLTAYYPILSTFNGMRQDPLLPLHFGVDFLAGIRFNYEVSLFRFHAAPAWHMLLLDDERWSYFNMGAAAVAGFELALSPGFTLLIDGTASIDDGNLGTNRLMEQFDVAWQYQIGLGIRYSFRMTNKSYLFDRSRFSRFNFPKFNLPKPKKNKKDPEPGVSADFNFDFDIEGSDGELSDIDDVDGFESFHR